MPVRLLVSIAILIATFLVLFLVLIASETALTVWHYLRQAPVWVQVLYSIVLVGLPLLTLFLFWSWFKPGKKKKKQETAKPTLETDPEKFQQNLVDSAQDGVDVSGALEELHEQRRRQHSGEVFIAVFGEVSAGKSSLVEALVPEATIESDPRAGTTTTVQHYRWQAPSGDQVVIADLPGFNLEDDREAREETRRAHLVVFLCDSDLTESEGRHIQQLKELGKPLVLALNKSDRYSNEEIERLLESLRQKSGLPPEDVVAIASGGREEVVQLLGEGVEQRVTRIRDPRIDALRLAVQRRLDEDRDLMESLRETAVIMLAGEKLEAARDLHRNEQADALVSRYSRRAVVGALAAVAPGSDLVIQGVLATRLIRELSKLYDVPVKEIEIEAFLDLAGGKIRNMTAITLAIAGNALKAFPGIGTISGGVVHAIAYGMIFDSLGRAAAQTMASRGELRPYPAAEAFEDLMHEHLESGALHFAKMAASQYGKSNKS